MELIDRYPGVPGCRLDTGEDNGRTGPALDLNGFSGGTCSLWVRESGTAVGKSAQIDLSVENLRALRDGCTRLLVEIGVEEEITVTIPSTKGGDVLRPTQLGRD